MAQSDTTGQPDWAAPLAVRDPRTELESIKWWDFDRSWTGWFVNWFLMFPFFGAGFVLAVGMTVWVAIRNLPYWWVVMPLACALTYLPLHSCIRHGKVNNNVSI